ncbi:MAG: transcription termination factor NusA [Candidatus Kapabacteria bacterium]|nr:transcription termination factor NusA [Candidatus Kapabacteria bacterium]
MRRRKAKNKIDKKLIIDAFAEMAKSKNIDRDLLQGIVEETISMIVKKKYGTEANFDIIVNMEKGDIEVYLMRTVVDEPSDPSLEISLTEAHRYDDGYTLGDEFIEEITLDNISDSFGRRLISLAGQSLNQKIRDVEKDNIYNEYASKVGEIIIGEIYQVRRNDLLIMHNKTEMRLPREEQIPNEPYKYKKNQSVKAIIKEVKRAGTGGQPEIILSRASEDFLARLFEIEIPEIYDGIIQIKAIARDPGERSKVAVMSLDDRVDPVGACVGMKGIRIHSIVRELNNENIDLIQYADEPKLYIGRALSPAKVLEINVQHEIKSATVLVPDDQVSLAIGKNGQNVKLASQLTGYSLTLIKEGGEDIELVEFKDELGNTLLKQLADLNISTVREFLDSDIGTLLAIPDLSKDMLLELRSIMLNELDEEEIEEMREKIMNFSIK